MIAPILIFGGFSLLFFLLSVPIFPVIVRSWRKFNLRRPGLTVEGRIIAQRSQHTGGGVRTGYLVLLTMSPTATYYQGQKYSQAQEVDEPSSSVLNEPLVKRTSSLSFMR